MGSTQSGLADVILMVVMTIVIRYHGGIFHTPHVVIIRIECGCEHEGVLGNTMQIAVALFWTPFPLAQGGRHCGMAARTQASAPA